MKLPPTPKTTLAVLVSDQLSKSLVVVAHLPHRLNTGGAFSLWADHAWFSPVALWILIILLAMWRWLKRFQHYYHNNHGVQMGWGLLLGGALSNTLDRLVRGGVIDFIQVGPFPNFNLADVAIVLGLAAITTTWKR